MSHNWPDLPERRDLADRAATQQDVEDGTAVFSMRGQGQRAFEIDVPQYVLWTDDNGLQHPRLLVQAEQAPTGLIIVGLLDFEGQRAAATRDELTLLGPTKPE